MVKQGYEPNVAFHVIGKARRAEVPDTVAQSEWVSNLAASGGLCGD